MQKSIWLITMLSMFLTYSCKKKDSPTYSDILDKITEAKIYDIGNTGTGSDILIHFSLAASHTLTEASIFLVPAGQTFSLKNAVDLAPALKRTVTLQKGVIQYKIKLSGLTQDVQGHTMTKESAYILYIFQKQDDLSGALSKGYPVILKDQDPVIGDYRGVWNDALFKNFTLTLRMMDAQNGMMFYSENFKSCCKGDHDGKVIIRSNGTTISSFTFNQFLGDYNGGHCEATYTAQGLWEDDISFTISNITGKDCDGVHTPGTATFIKLPQ
jgi:hypothetical protein